MHKKHDKSYLIILVLLFIVAICSYLLYLNINKGASENTNKVIGTLTFKNQTIERKYDSDVIWEKIESGLLIRNKDTIRSGDFSDAVLTLKDKTKININENSMIYLDMTDNDINLNFSYGSMSLSKQAGESSDSTLKIKSGNSIVEVKNSDLSLEKKGKDNLSFQVNKGTAKLTNGNKEKELKTNETASLNGNEIKVAEINLNLISPADASIISDKSQSIPVNFTWSAKNGNKLKLEIAQDSRFQKIYKIFNVDNSSYTLNLEKGNYYWRISSEKNKSTKKTDREYSQFRRLSVYTISPPTILSPKKNQIFSYLDTTPIIHFNWKLLETARNYKLEISKNSGFTEIIKTITTSQTTASVDKLEHGKYFARLIAEPALEEFKQEKSEPVTFSIEKNFELDSPILVSPGNRQELSAYLFAKSGFLFQVKDSPELSNYTFQISSKPNFANVLIEQKSNSNQIKLLSKLEVGEYYWRVFGSTNDGRKTPFSEIRTFFLKENQPVELLSPLNHAVVDIKQNPIFFRWKRQAYKTKFLLEVSNTSEFTEKLHSSKTNEYSTSYSFSKEGIYFWRIFSLSEDESVLSQSAVFTFQLEEIKEIIPIYPSKYKKVDMAPKDSLHFKWENNPKIDSYLFELFKKKSGTLSLIIKTKTKNNAFVFKDLSKLDEGDFVWTLQETNEENEILKSRKKVTVPFSIFLSEKPGAPKIKTSKKMYVE